MIYDLVWKARKIRLVRTHTSASVKIVFQCFWKTRFNTPPHFPKGVILLSMTSFVFIDDFISQIFYQKVLGVPVKLSVTYIILYSKSYWQFDWYTRYGPEFLIFERAILFALFKNYRHHMDIRVLYLANLFGKRVF